MKEIFQTFKPKSTIIQKYVDYYYLDIKPNNIINEFQCFPHFNNTISIYKSHNRLENGTMVFDETTKPFQIFTPIREKVLDVTQIGRVHRIVVVFNPLGIQQFYRNLNFTNYITDFNFLNEKELKKIFSTTKTEILVDLLDDFFEKKIQPFNNQTLEDAISYIFEHNGTLSITEISNKIGISRQHLNRIFQLHLGVSIKKFQNIVIFRKTINEKLFENPENNFTELAHKFNFNDQSHLIKTYKHLTEQSPKVFFDKGKILGDEDTFWHLQS
ncbi:helix-turn-helix domain-containing protein [Myroides sp. DW712]|uniref:helix-turn-helix domain-containing protein n=1 Tax=Myroides sp. DW712 TaxID=3389800 RepID=UPI00397A0212